MAFPRYEHAGGAIVAALASGISSGDTSLALVAATNWPTGGTGPFWIVIDPGTSSEEKILVTSRSTTTLSGLTRGADGTSAASHATGAVVEHIFAAAEADDDNAAAHGTLGLIAAKGDLLAGSAANTLVKVAVGADGLPLVADAASGGGLHYATLAAAATPLVIPKAVGTAKGSLVTFSAPGTPAELAVGTNLLPLVANSGATNGIDYERLNVTSMAVAPFCRLYDSTPTAVPNNSKTYNAGWDTEITDTDTMHDAVTNPGRITFNTAGIYTVTAAMELHYSGTANTDRSASVSVMLNHTTEIGTGFSPFADNAVSSAAIPSVTFTRAFNVADYIEVATTQFTGSSITPGALSESYPIFSACFIGLQA